MSEPTSIPSDLVTRARALGHEALELVMEAYQRARREERAHAIEQAIAACEEEGQERAERFVDLPPEEMVALEARLGAMPAPVVGAFYEGVAEAVEACCARLRVLAEAPLRAPH